MSETSLKAFTAQSTAKRFALPEPKFEEEAEYQAFAFGRVGRRPEIMIEFHKADGFRLNVQYIDIKEIETTNPDKGFSIRTPMHKFIIEGANLDRCYRYLQQNRIAELKEIDRPTAMSTTTDEAIITSLRIQ